MTQETLLLQKPKYMRLGLSQAKAVYGSLTSDEWEESYRFLEALWEGVEWHRITIKRFKDEYRSNTWRAK